MKGSRESSMEHGEMDFAEIKEVRGAHPYHIEIGRQPRRVSGHACGAGFLCVPASRRLCVGGSRSPRLTAAISAPIF